MFYEKKRRRIFSRFIAHPRTIVSSRLLIEPATRNLKFSDKRFWFSWIESPEWKTSFDRWRASGFPSLWLAPKTRAISHNKNVSSLCWRSVWLSLCVLNWNYSIVETNTHKWAERIVESVSQKLVSRARDCNGLKSLSRKSLGVLVNRCDAN